MSSLALTSPASTGSEASLSVSLKSSAVAPPYERTSDGLVKTLHSPLGIPEENMFFNEEEVFPLVMEYQSTHSIETWKKIVEKTLKLIDTTIRHYGFDAYDSHDCLRSECVIKLHRVLEKYDPARGRCFTHFSISVKHHLISYIQKLKNKARLATAVDDKILELTEAAAYIPADISADFKAKFLEVETRFRDPAHLSALKFLLNHFLVEGFGSSKTKLALTLTASYGLTPEQAYLLYDYALLKMREVTFEYYAPAYTEVEILRMSRRWSLLPEVAEAIGIPAFTKLAALFGGMTVTFPTPKDIARLRSEKAVLEAGERDASYANLHALGSASGANEGNAIFWRLSKASLENYHSTAPLYEEEETMERMYSREFDPEEEPETEE